MESCYTEETHDFAVEVTPAYIEDQSDPAAGFYFYAYHVKITNRAHMPARLISRNWLIRDGRGREEQVSGQGVVGEQPYLQPGESFEYTSACPLSTPTGNMRGHYTLVDDRGQSIRVRIPVFFLRPELKH